MALSPLEVLQAIEEIKVLRYRWSRCVDLAQWDEFESLLAPEATLDLSATTRLVHGEDAAPAPVQRGASQVRRFLEQRMTGEQVHVAVMPEITVHSPAQASGIWLQESFIARARQRGKAGIGYGRVYDRYVRLAGQWKFEAVRVTVDVVV
jgi:hypothetical protein